MLKKEAVFVIEHLEPELGEWCMIEYKHISKIVGEKRLLFTNIKKKGERKILEKYGKVTEKSVKELKLKDACILDPESPERLTSKNSDKYSYFIFGGILGNYPPQKRTKKELTKFLKRFPEYNIGKSQMSTDNAVYIAKKIIEGVKFEKIPFQDKIEIKINKIESTILPYRYALVKRKPLISTELKRYLKSR